VRFLEFGNPRQKKRKKKKRYRMRSEAKESKVV